MVSEFANSSSNSVWERSVAGSAGIPFWGVQPGDMYFYKQGTAWPTAVMTSAGWMGLGTSLPRARIEAVTTDTIAGLFLSNSSDPGTKILRGEYTGSGPMDAVGVYGRSAPQDGLGVGGMFDGGRIGIAGRVYQNGTGLYRGVDASAHGTGTGTKQAVFASTSSPSSECYGVYSVAEGGLAYGLSATASGTGSGARIGVDAIASGDDGYTIGVQASASGSNSLKYGVYGGASGAAGTRYGVYGSAFGDVGSYGVYGNAVGTNANGMYANANGENSSGLISIASGGASYKYGVEARAEGTGIKTAIYAYASPGNASSRAGSFIGNVHVAGTLSKSAGAFTIDHPLDPANKYLQHSFVESPDMMNIYNGNVTTDVSGFATISLPNWFESLNKDFRYQLTVLGQFAQAIVSEKIANNQFVIQTDKPNVEVSWQVTGIRKDAYAEANRIEVEVDKPAHERGKYQFPKLFGKPEELGLDYEFGRQSASRRAATLPLPELNRSGK